MTNEQKSWKSRLASLNIKQADFAKIAGLYKATLCDYLNLKREPLAETHQRIERLILEIEKTSLRTGEETRGRV